MAISDTIANMIEQMLAESGGSLEIKRNELAGRMGCVPSQINYVITSRFTPERGYIIESRRGGGGYIRIIQRRMDKNEYLMHFFHAVGDSLDSASASAFTNNLFANALISEREMRIIAASLSAMPDDRLRAALMRQLTLEIMK